MGLDVSHGAYSASYSTFNNFREAVLKAYNGMNLFEFKGFEGVKRDGRKIEYKSLLLEDYVFSDGLLIFLNHSDCDGEISYTDCKIVADSLRFLIGKVQGYEHYLKDFIDGCELAFNEKENLEFT